MVLEERVSRLEGAYEQVDRRLGDLNASMEALRTDLNGRIDAMGSDLTGRIEAMGSDTNGRFGEVIGRIDSLNTEMDRRFNTLYMVVGSTSVAILIAVIGLMVTVILKP